MDCSPATEVESETETASNPRPTGSEPETVEGAVGGSEAAALQPKPVSEPRLIPPDLVIFLAFQNMLDQHVLLCSIMLETVCL